MTLTQLLAGPVPGMSGSAMFSACWPGWSDTYRAVTTHREFFILCRILNNEPY